ncbi:Putative zinc-or iron-chelating domain-containing protein [Salinibacillus kushneri]|uniref:Putative zinc-or iron-chelating domain-containing protein n=1 Tax=Salinibacillus kushneri TaxID=237682 RepID=A0A1I0GQ71_9BACI|nr:YkgJ family cysteine cluster protein [Salinibacillus kushneri]SET73458.1 Putative zinc-or iron-chelating domain-containing protein [Salinibacillus kushneri]
MKTYLSFEEIQEKMQLLQNSYQIDEEKFYRVVEAWADEDTDVEQKLLASFQELLQLVSGEMEQMDQTMGMKPTCQMGCAFCCYFPIIVSKMEAKLMTKAIEQFPADRRQSIMAHLTSYYETYGKKLDTITSMDYEEDPDFKRKYIRSHVPCPLLNTETNMCMAYEIRPIPCRTYVNYTDPNLCAENDLPEETISFEFLYNEYMGALNEFVQFLYEEEHTAFINYPDDLFSYDYLPNWLKVWHENQSM